MSVLRRSGEIYRRGLVACKGTMSVLRNDDESLGQGICHKDVEPEGARMNTDGFVFIDNRCPRCNENFTQTRTVDGKLYRWCPICEHVYETTAKTRDIGLVPCGLIEDGE